MAEQNKETKKSNAERFISAYNNIDYTLKARYNFSRSMGFSDLIRKVVSLNYVIRKNEDDLIDYGRLRNAIVHNNDEYVIAEPHDSVVENIELIEKLITRPPRALDYARRDVLTVEANKTMYDVITLITTSKYSNIPVYDNNELVGIANGQKILDSFGQFLLTGGKADVFLHNVKIEDMLTRIENSNYYMVVPADYTIEQVLEQFHLNNRLLAILITKTGDAKELPLGIITGVDTIEMNKVLDQYT